MLTLDTPPEAFIEHPEMIAPPLCRTTVRLRRWKDKSWRDLLARPPQMAIVDACLNVKNYIWAHCDDDLKAAIDLYLEKTYERTT